MSRECMNLEDLTRVGGLPAGDPRLRHAEECPRCSALLASYRAFDRSEAEGSAAEQREAEERLGELIARELGLGRVAGTARAPRVALSSRWLDLLRRPALRPAWALAGLVVVAGAWMLARGFDAGRPREVRLRAGGARPPVVAVEAARTVPGGVELRWHAVPGAESYSLELSSPELEPLARLGPVRDTVFVLGRGQAGAGGSGEEVFWQVTALREGARIAASRLEPVRLP